MKEKVLIADDERQLTDTLAYAFTREGYQVLKAYDGQSAYELILKEHPTLAILDISMPYMSGFDILKTVGTTWNMGVILLTAKTDIIDKVLGLEFGADDYMTKPFDMREVLARSSSLLRRLHKVNPTKNDTQLIKSNGFSISATQRTVFFNGTIINLTPKEFDLLLLLVTHSGQVFSRDSLLENIWSYDYDGGTRTVDIHIQRLRKKLGPLAERALHTVYKIGYKWVEV